MEGVTPAIRGSGGEGHAYRARPKALNTVSVWWWLLAPRRLSMWRVTRAWFDKALEELEETGPRRSRPPLPG